MYDESALLIIGDELLSGRTRDVNLFRFSGLLGDAGLPLSTARVVRDVPGRISASVSQLLRRGTLLVVSGGMGPTDDDVTVAAVAHALGRPMERSPEAERMVREKQERYGLGLPDSALKQADVPAGAIPVLNPVGIAPGLVIMLDGSAVICVPGVPAESAALLPECLRIAGVRPGKLEKVHFIRTWGLKENALYDSLRDAAAAHGVIPAYLPSPGRVDIKVTGDGAGDFTEHVLSTLRGRVYSTLRDETLEEVLGAKLIERGYFMAVAESCTGGGIGRGITSVPGSSEWFVGGIISYSNGMKSEMLKVPGDILLEKGAVSRETALAMAHGVIRLTGADCSVAVTGIAGPGGGSGEKPVGTVWTAAAAPSGERADLWRLGGDREAVRDGAAARALGSLLELLG